MNVSKLTIFYGCYYCKKEFSTVKENLKQHWSDGCKRMRECYSARLIVQSSPELQYVTVYFNPKNIDIDLEKQILKQLRWPILQIHFTTHSNWKKTRQENYLRESSEEE
jgi:phosphoribosylanthranilate isomerase